jgi:hypothetical protein
MLPFNMTLPSWGRNAGAPLSGPRDWAATEGRAYKPILLDRRESEHADPHFRGSD